jgi:hypothetical protein
MNRAPSDRDCFFREPRISDFGQIIVWNNEYSFMLLDRTHILGSCPGTWHWFRNMCARRIDVDISEIRE